MTVYGWGLPHSSHSAMWQFILFNFQSSSTLYFCPENYAILKSSKHWNYERTDCRRTYLQKKTKKKREGGRLRPWHKRSSHPLPLLPWLFRSQLNCDFFGNPPWPPRLGQISLVYAPKPRVLLHNLRVTILWPLFVYYLSSPQPHKLHGVKAWVCLCPPMYPCPAPDTQ